jgi:hypothetical protein
MNIDTISSLARKLAALSAPGNGATDAERNTAAAKLSALLHRHGLTWESIADERPHDLTICCLHRLEIELLVQVVADIRNTNRVTYTTSSVTIPVTGKNGQPTKRRRKAKQIFIKGLTLAELTDINACYAHYLKILQKLLADLDQEVRRITRSKKNAVKAIASRYQVGPKTGDAPPTPLKPEELAAVLSAMRACTGEAWQRPAGSLNSSTPLIAS